MTTTITKKTGYSYAIPFAQIKVGELGALAEGIVDGDRECVLIPILDTIYKK